jgi:antirestriction protein ArdC
MTSLSNADATEKRSQLVAQLRQGVEQVKDSQRFAEYLTCAARFHRYSFNNRMLIWLQRPDASQVAGFQTWKSLGRHVTKGEKGIAILAPVAFRRAAEQGAGEEEGEQETVAVGFRAVHVFDISQTEGEPLPSLTSQLRGDADELLAGLKSVAEAEGLAISEAPEAGREGVGGYYDSSKRLIWLNPSTQASAQMAQTLAHELAHHFAREERCNRAEGEIVADAAAYLVLGHHGIDAGAFSFDYVAVWASRAEPGAFEQQLSAAHKAADAILCAIGRASDQ